MANSRNADSGWFGKSLLILIIWIVLGAGAWWIFGRGGDEPAGLPAGPGDFAKVEPAPAEAKNATKIGIAYGTEKESWLKEVVEEFARTEDAQRVSVDLIPMGSIEGGHAVLDEDQRIVVWSPASSMYRATFEQEWDLRHGGKVIAEARDSELALTPMVFVMWKERYDAFREKYKDVSFSTISQALREEGGWGGIASKPEWGLFKFGHTRPDQSNSGLMTLVLMAYDFHKKNSGLTVSDIVNPEFQKWLRATETAFKVRTNSTGNLMRDMVLRGPSEYDGVVVYESVAIDQLKNAEGRWGELYVVYPERNIWNNNPYYLLDAPWTTDEKKSAAKTFLKFLMSEPVQQKALLHGFRPGNLTVPVKIPDSPFMRYAKYGVMIDVNIASEPPTGPVLNNLQQAAQLIYGSK
jgi:hypothetical protein